jgi:FMN reductase
MNIAADSLLQPPAAAVRSPIVLGIGGTPRPRSTSEQALRATLRAAESQGALTDVITAQELDLPMYDPGRAALSGTAARLVDAVRRADGLIIAAPAYHGGPSGLLKNALDYFQELAGDTAPYLHGKAVGCIVCADGWQAAAVALTSLRTTIHALRGWPTPLGVAINSASKPFASDGSVDDVKVDDQLHILAGQVVAFARSRQMIGAAA